MARKAFKQHTLALDGGFHAGPLFVVQKRRQAVQYSSGGAKVWAKYKRARPPWATPASVAAFWRESMRVTATTGVQHSVDHIVPLCHPLVCGLHCADNLRVIPMAENAHKSNSHWPDMWGEQLSLV